MKTIHDILKLGDPRLYEICEPVLESELSLVFGWVLEIMVKFAGKAHL
jgi:peptide deformylase